MTKLILFSIFLAPILFGLSAFAQVNSFKMDTLIFHEILNHSKVLSLIGDEGGIESISKSGDTVTLVAGECSLEVKIEYKGKSEAGGINASEDKLPPHRLDIGLLQCWNQIWPR